MEDGREFLSIYTLNHQPYIAGPIQDSSYVVQPHQEEGANHLFCKKNPKTPLN